VHQRRQRGARLTGSRAGYTDLTHWETVRVQWLTRRSEGVPPAAANARRPRGTDFGNIMTPTRGVPATPMPMPRFMTQLVAAWRKEGVFDPPVGTD
jgi:hypothetical protein